VPLLEDLHDWMVLVHTEVENGSALAKALNYALNRWESLLRYTEDGRLEIDNNIAERSVRGSCVGKKNYSLIETCKLNHIDPNRYLQYVPERIADYPINRVEELLPWTIAAKLNQLDQVTQALVA
jgi:transposase